MKARDGPKMQTSRRQSSTGFSEFKWCAGSRSGMPSRGWSAPAVSRVYAAHATSLRVATSNPCAGIRHGPTNRTQPARRRTCHMPIGVASFASCSMPPVCDRMQSTPVRCSAVQAAFLCRYQRQCSTQDPAILLPIACIIAVS